jgi:hypothetical protein
MGFYRKRQFRGFRQIPFGIALDHAPLFGCRQFSQIPIILIYVNQMALFRSRLEAITADFLSGARCRELPERAKPRSGSPKIWVMSVEDLTAAWTWVLGKAEVGGADPGRCGWVARIRLPKARDEGKGQNRKPEDPGLPPPVIMAPVYFFQLFAATS